jgi:hypothetical protein
VKNELKGGNPMGLFDRIKMRNDKKREFNEILKSGGMSVAFVRAKYLGGHPDLLGEKDGNITVNGQGLFFNDSLTFDYIFIPAEKISQAEFKTGEQIAKNAFFSRLLALGGFSFAFNKNTRDKHMYLTVSHYVNGIENTVLFETNSASKLASAMAKVRQDYAKNNPKESNGDVPVSELIKQISELKALGILTDEEYAEKKKDLLSRF